MEKIQAEAPITPRGMSEEDAARYIGDARISLRHGRCEGRREHRMPPPPYIKLGRKVIYLKDDLDRWLEMYRVALAIVLIILTSR